MTDTYIPKMPLPALYNIATGKYQLSQTTCKKNAANWRICASNAANRADWKEVEYCQAKARKIAGWLEDLIEERSN